MTRAIRLDGRATTLLLLARPHGLPEIVHWGARLPDGIALNAASALRDRAVPQNALDVDIAQATLFPTLGAGIFMAPALAAHRDARDWTADFSEVDIRAGAGAVAITAVDPLALLRLSIHLGLAPDDDVLTMRVTLSNQGDAPLHVTDLAAGCFLLPAAATELLTFDGYWSHEFTERRLPLAAGRFVSENRRGRTSHDRHPALIAGSRGFSEDAGSIWGVALGWSGNHRVSADRLEDGYALVTVGELLHPGETIIAPGESLETPTAYSSFSADGLAGLSRNFHRHVRRHLLRWPGATMRPRPVTLNTWEGMYFDHDLDRLKRQASAAAALGVERFVLDDGWMKGRHDDTAGLGDWVPDAGKYPVGLAPLAGHVTGLGMEFGLWVEPEMVNPDSDLYRTHPDVVLHVAGRPLRTARNQLVLDLTRPAMVAHIFDALDTLLRTLPIAYLKWDMNRDLVAAADALGRPAYRRQVLALYELLDRLRIAHPALEIESCASGGGRADFGVLARTHRVWTSDCTDALQRLDIQRGASRFLPPELLGAHISASPNHQTGRRHTLAFRAAVALFGHLGIELDPLTLDNEQAREVSAWIALHQRLRPLLHGGEHVAAPDFAGRILRGVVANDGSRAAYLVAQTTASDRRRAPPLMLPGLDQRAVYRVTAPAQQRPSARMAAAGHALFADGLVMPAALLAIAGLTLPDLLPESAILLEAVREGSSP